MEVVERYAVCPWAKAARQNGRIRSCVVTSEVSSAKELQSRIDAWAEDDECDVGFLIYPAFDAGYEEFDQWTAQVGNLRSDVFLSASFHPDAPSNAGVVRFLRQTPDPTAQLVRRSRLEEVRAQDPPHYQDIFELDLAAMSAATPARTVAASVLQRNTRLVAKNRNALARLLGRGSVSATARNEAPGGPDE